MSGVCQRADVPLPARELGRRAGWRRDVASARVAAAGRRPRAGHARRGRDGPRARGGPPGSRRAACPVEARVPQSVGLAQGPCAVRRGVGREGERRVDGVRGLGRLHWPGSRRVRGASRAALRRAGRRRRLRATVAAPAPRWGHGHAGRRQRRRRAGPHRGARSDPRSGRPLDAPVREPVAGRGAEDDRLRARI